MAVAEWDKVERARQDWVAVYDRRREKWPKWVNDLDGTMQVWLDGETVEYAAFGWEPGPDEFADNALESTSLWVWVLTPKFVLKATLPKLFRSVDAGSPVVVIVPREAISDLRFERAAANQPPGIIIHASYPDLGELRIPADPDDWGSPNEDERVAVWRGLRDDLYLGGRERAARVHTRKHAATGEVS